MPRRERTVSFAMLALRLTGLSGFMILAIAGMFFLFFSPAGRAQISRAETEIWIGAAVVLILILWSAFVLLRHVRALFSPVRSVEDRILRKKLDDEEGVSYFLHLAGNGRLEVDRSIFEAVSEGDEIQFEYSNHLRRPIRFAVKGPDQAD